MATAAFARRPLSGVLALAVLAAACATAAIAADGEAGTTYAATSLAAHAADLTAGLGLLTAGFLAGAQDRTRRLGVLALLMSIAWFGPDIDGWESAPALVRSLGTPAAPFLVVLLLHLALAAPGRRVASRLARAAIGSAYGVAAVVTLGRALFRDPLLDLYCWRNCRDNAFLLHADPRLARAIDVFWSWSAAAIGIIVVAVVVSRLRRATGPARNVLLPVIFPAAFAGGAEAVYALALLRTPLENPTSREFAALFLTRALVLSALALGIAWSALRFRWIRARVSRLAADLAQASPLGTLGEALAVAVGDPSIEVLYPLSDSHQLVEANGRRRDAPVPQHGRAITQITRGRQPLALIVHDAELIDQRGLEREIGSAARLAVENEALNAEVLAQIDELRSSRARIVETGDAARRRLERDLHDGAQQRLLAVSLELKLARAAANQNGDETLAAEIESAAEQVDVAFNDLRELAHGIYPAVLTEAGLGAALATLADSAPIALELGDIPNGRLPQATEIGAYVTVTHAIRDAAGRGATFLSLDVVPADDRVVITTRDDGAGRAAVPVHLADRVGALGGSIDIASAGLRAELPCA